MSDIAIRVEAVSKQYRIGPREGYKTLRDSLTTALCAPRRFLRGHWQTPAEAIWALRDVSFDVRQGEVLGVIGRNGAGKSTLLKILSRVTRPTRGRAEIHGRVGSLLEVGTGFHPELTGRENVYLSGAILGMRKSEIDHKLDEIVAFAEVERFLETPVKHYSSGMYVRLAFAVAAHLEPEVLLVDEVLAVGDSQFQKKCQGKMGEATTTGRTILFVSHNMSAVQALCSRVLLFRDGELIAAGPSDAVLRAYLRDSATDHLYTRAHPMQGQAVVISASVTEHAGREDAVDFSLLVHSQGARGCTVDLRISDTRGAPVGFASLGTLVPDEMVSLHDGRNLIEFTLPVGNLASGDYLVSFDLTHPDAEYYDRVENGVAFSVVRPPRGGAIRVVQQRWGYGSIEFRLTNARTRALGADANGARTSGGPTRP